MKTIREIIFNTLIKKHGVQPHLLSRIENDDPVVIELTSGSEIVVEFEKEKDQKINTYIKIPIKNMQDFIRKSQKVIESLTLRQNDFLISVQPKEKRVFILRELPASNENMRTIENDLSQVLEDFNNIANIIA